jgi:hypothetical protein
LRPQAIGRTMQYSECVVEMSVVATTGSRSGSSSGRVVLALAALASPLFLYLIVRTAMVGLRPPMAATLPPTDFAPFVGELIPAFADPRIPIPAQPLSMARRATLTAPLAEDPFFLFGRQAATEGKLDRAIRLMEESRRRRPNFIPTRLLLMAYYSQAQRYPKAVAEMEYALRSSETVRGLVLPELVKALRTPDGRAALAGVLARRPEWREEFIRTAEGQPVSPEEASDLLERVRAKRPNADLSLERGLYLQTLVKAGRSREARSVWLASYPEAERARHQLLFDGGFAGAAAPQPFGWSLRDTEAGRAEIVRSGRTSYLEVNYFGGRTVVVAEQMLTLDPGSYRLSFEAKSEGGITSGELAWSVACVSDGPEIGRIRILGAQPAYRRYQGDVNVPAGGCAAQMVRLVADPGDVAAAFTAQIDNMHMVRR